MLKGRRHAVDLDLTEAVPAASVASAERRAQSLIEWMAEVAEQRQRKQGNPDQ